MKKKVCAATRVGGQAVLEGIMMKSGENVCTAVRLADGGSPPKSVNSPRLPKNIKYSSYRL